MSETEYERILDKMPGGPDSPEEEDFLGEDDRDDRDDFDDDTLEDGGITPEGSFHD